jgi:hypothetical protein
LAISYLTNKKFGIGRKKISEFFGVSGQAISQSFKLGEKTAKERGIGPLCC